MMRSSSVPCHAPKYSLMNDSMSAADRIAVETVMAVALVQAAGVLAVRTHGLIAVGQLIRGSASFPAAESGRSYVIVSAPKAANNAPLAWWSAYRRRSQAGRVCGMDFLWVAR